MAADAALEEVVEDAALEEAPKNPSLEEVVEEDPDYGLKPASTETVCDGASLGVEGTC